MFIQEAVRPYRGLPKSVYFLFISKIVNSIGNFVMPFLAIFLTDRLGMREDQAGFFVMLAAIAFVPGSLIGGKLADIYGRKKVLILFHGLSGLCFVPCAFLGPSMLVTWLLVASSLFIGASNPAYTAMVTDLTDMGNRKQAFSLIYLGHNIGFALGPVIAGFLYRRFMPMIFIGDALTTFAALALVMLYIRETMPEDYKTEAENMQLNCNEKPEEGGLIPALLKRPVLLAFSFVAMIYSFVYSQCGFGLPLQINEIFALDGPRNYGVLASVNAVTVVSMTLIVTQRTSRLRPVFCIALGGLFYAIGFGMIFYLNSMYMFIISTIIWTIGEILVVTNTGVFIANNTPISHRGRFNAVIPIITGTGFAVGPLLTGKFLISHSIREIWPLCFYLAFGATMLMIMLNMAEKWAGRKEEQTAFITERE